MICTVSNIRCLLLEKSFQINHKRIASEKWNPNLMHLTDTHFTFNFPNNHFRTYKYSNNLILYCQTKCPIGWVVQVLLSFIERQKIMYVGVHPLRKREYPRWLSSSRTFCCFGLLFLLYLDSCMVWLWLESGWMDGQGWGYTHLFYIIF